MVTQCNRGRLRIDAPPAPSRFPSHPAYPRHQVTQRIADGRHPPRAATNQLAGFTKQSDLPWFLDTIAGISYAHELALAPSEGLMRAYRKEGLPFDEFAKRLRAEFAERKMPKLIDGSALLCSEPDPGVCHRSVAAAYLAEQDPSIEVVHL